MPSIRGSFKETPNRAPSVPRWRCLLNVSQMSRKRKSEPSWPLPLEMKAAILAAGPSLLPCKSRYARLSLDKVYEHIQKDRCQQCLLFCDQLHLESTLLLWFKSHLN